MAPHEKLAGGGARVYAIVSSLRVELIPSEQTGGSASAFKK